MVNVQVQVEYGFAVAMELRTPTELVLTIETDDSEGMNGGVVSVVFPDPVAALLRIAEAMTTLANGK